MSGSETGVMTSREPFSVGLQKSPVPSQPVIQNMRLVLSADGTAVYKPIAATSPSYQSSVVGVESGAGGAVGDGDGGDGSPGVPQGINMNMGSEPVKRKRGRPRKYGPDGSMALALAPAPPAVTVTQSSGGGFSPPPASGGSASPTSLKKARGRPPGSSKKQQLEALGNSFWILLLLLLLLFSQLNLCG